MGAKKLTTFLSDRGLKWKGSPSKNLDVAWGLLQQSLNHLQDPNIRVVFVGSIHGHFCGVQWFDGGNRTQTVESQAKTPAEALMHNVVKILGGNLIELGA